MKCPKCKAEITSLKAYSEIVHNFTLNDDGSVNLEGGFDHLEGYTSFECPECCEKLFDDEELEAIKFLKNGR